MNESRTVVVYGMELTYLERRPHSEQAKPPLLLLHGLIASAQTFSALIDRLPDDRRIVALDLPGRDLRHAEPSPMGLRSLSELVVALCQALQLDMPIVLGHSHGGAIALQIGTSFADRVSGLILLAPAHPFLYRERRMIGFFNSGLGNFVARKFRSLPRFVHGLGFTRLLGPKGRKANVDFRPYRVRLMEPATVEAVLRLIKTWNADLDALGLAFKASPIRLPALLLWGDRDPVVPLQTSQPLLAHFNHRELETLTGVGHLPNDEAAPECAELIGNWLARFDAGALKGEQA